MPPPKKRKAVKKCVKCVAGFQAIVEDGAIVGSEPCPACAPPARAKADESR
jgi:hypothetical protein